MEERTLQPSQPHGPTTIAAVPAAPAAAPQPPPRMPTGGDDAPAVISSGDETTDGDSVDDEGGFEFEFPLVSRDSPAGTASLADELFADGRIRPLYPVFGRRGGGVRGGGDDDGAARWPAPPPPRVRGQLGRLFLEESRARNSSTSSTASTASSSSSAATDDEGGMGLGGVAPESYCLWTPGCGSSAPPSPRPPRKSGSTGSMARWRRIGELVVGRSHSDGKEKFMFLPTPPPPRREASNHHDKQLKPRPSPAASVARKGAPATRAAEADAAHRIAYAAKGGDVPGGATPRRTFLPYREELVGFFANVNGISRSHHHPF